MNLPHLSSSSFSLSGLSARVRRLGLIAPTRDWLLLLAAAALCALGGAGYAATRFLEVSALRGADHTGDTAQRVLIAEEEIAQVLEQFTTRDEEYQAVLTRYQTVVPTPPVTAEEDEVPRTPEDRALVGEEEDAPPQQVDLVP